jgi:hypothetical protein
MLFLFLNKILRDIVKKFAQWLNRVIAQVLELGNELFSQLIIDHRDREWTWLIGQKVAIVGALQMKLQVYFKIGELETFEMFNQRF